MTNFRRVATWLTIYRLAILTETVTPNLWDYPKTQLNSKLNKDNFYIIKKLVMILLII